jgi:hypothetical protein
MDEGREVNPLIEKAKRSTHRANEKRYSLDQIGLAVAVLNSEVSLLQCCEVMGTTGKTALAARMMTWLIHGVAEGVVTIKLTEEE